MTKSPSLPKERMEIWELNQQFIEGEKRIKRVTSSLEQKDHKQALSIANWHSLTWGWAQAVLAVGAICGFESDCWRGFNTLKVSWCYCPPQLTNSFNFYFTSWCFREKAFSCYIASKTTIKTFVWSFWWFFPTRSSSKSRIWILTVLRSIRLLISLIRCILIVLWRNIRWGWELSRGVG